MVEFGNLVRITNSYICSKNPAVQRLSKSPEELRHIFENFLKVPSQNIGFWKLLQFPIA